MSDDLFWPDSDGEFTTEPLDRPYETAPPPAPARSRPWRTVAVAAGLSALVFGGAGVGIGAALEANSGDSSAQIGSTGLDATQPQAALAVHPCATLLGRRSGEQWYLRGERDESRSQHLYAGNVKYSP